MGAMLHIPPTRDTSRSARGYDPRSDIVRGRDIALVTGLDRSTVWRLRRAGLFPAPLRLGVQAIGWRRADIEAWLMSRERAR
jgi:prophage regulatory protein